MKYILFCLCLLGFYSCGKSSDSQTAAPITLNSALYGGTWVNNDGNITTRMIFTGNQVNFREEVLGTEVTNEDYALTPISSNKVIVDDGNTEEEWSYVVNGDNLNLCINSCVHFARAP